MSVLKHSLHGLALLLAFNAPAYATIISNTLDGSIGDTPKSLTSRGAAGSFTADATGNVGSLEIDLARSSAVGAVAITLNADNSGIPGAVLNTIATLQSSTLPTSETLVGFYNLPITGLTAGSTYWIETAKTSASTGAQAFTTTTAAATGTGQSYWPGSTPTLTSPLLAFCVSSDNACNTSFPPAAGFSTNAAPAPEPGSVAIVGAGLAGLGWIRRRKTRG